MNGFLLVGGGLSVIAAVLHIVIIFGGAEWYRYFGAGERMAKMSEQGSIIPGLITFFIALVLFVWGLYAFAGTGLIQLTLPFVKYALVAISGVYLIRGLVLFPALLFKPEIVDGFAIWSSLLSLFFGLCYAIGTVQVFYSS